MKCEQFREVHIFTKHRLSARFSSIDGIGRVHMSCDDCGKSICLKGKREDYKKDQIVYEENGGEV